MRRVVLPKTEKLSFRVFYIVGVNIIVRFIILDIGVHNSKCSYKITID